MFAKPDANIKPLFLTPLTALGARLTLPPLVLVH